MEAARPSPPLQTVAAPREPAPPPAEGPQIGAGNRAAGPGAARVPPWPVSIMSRGVKPLVIPDDDYNTLWRTLWGEGRGEGYRGMVAIAWVIRNRVEADLWGDGKPDWWGEGVGPVCLKPGQFTCWWDHNADKLRKVPPAQEQAVVAIRAASAVMDGTETDPTGGADHYYAPGVVPMPSWAKGRKPTASIGGHLFFRLRADERA